MGGKKQPATSLPNSRRLKKITIEVPEHVLERVQKYTDLGISESIRMSLQYFLSGFASKELAERRGTTKLRED